MSSTRGAGGCRDEFRVREKKGLNLGMVGCDDKGEEGGRQLHSIYIYMTENANNEMILQYII